MLRDETEKTMNIQNIISTLEGKGFDVKLYQNNHLRIFRKRGAPFQGPRVISYWPGSKRKTAYDENVDASWAPATTQGIIDVMNTDPDTYDNDPRAVS